MAISKLLIANRGEIAVRIIRTCKEMGIRTVAVYSEADAGALHVKWADERVALGDPAPANSYLSVEKIIGAALATGADAIHPGYGFLSERPEFAEACVLAGLIFVGPSAKTMRSVGDKISAKKLAVQAGVPIVPGFFESGASPEVLLTSAKQIGFPVMLKASAGGGGRGMRVVRREEEFLESLGVAANEALNAFGDGAMMIEKLVERPRHVEVQIVGDHYGTVACLFERECSIQRRHQKLIEEAPSPFLNARSTGFDWEAMRAAATKIASASEYTNLGTVEFMVDQSSGQFYFLEVNARLQVEHPVTEAITSLDLVRLQLEISQDEKLDLRPELLSGQRAAIGGCAIEVRIIAEDPAKGFMPSAGKILGWAEPKAPGVRLDTGFAVGSQVPTQYDSLLAKLIVHGASRSAAIAKMTSALMDFHILGVQTNIAYLLDVISHPDFIDGRIDTEFLGRCFEAWNPGPIPSEIAALAQSALFSSSKDGVQGGGNLSNAPAWETSDGFRSAKSGGLENPSRTPPA